MAYKKVSQTSSGWDISNDPDAPAEKQWRIVHPEWGTRFYPTHKEASISALTEGVERLERLCKLLKLD